jgi:hypothetical protein
MHSGFQRDTTARHRTECRVQGLAGGRYLVLQNHASGLVEHALLEAGHAAEAEALVHQAATDLGAENKNDPGTGVLLAISLLDQGKLADTQLVVDEIKKNQPKLADPLQVWQIEIAEARVSSARGIHCLQSEN